jgi:hypothetical protein
MHQGARRKRSVPPRRRAIDTFDFQHTSRFDVFEHVVFAASRREGTPVFIGMSVALTEGEVYESRTTEVE